MKQALLLITVLLLSCSKKDNSDSNLSNKVYSDKDIVNGGNLIIGITGEPDGLNPLTAHTKNAKDIISLVYRRLADLNQDLVSFTPQLAKSWKYSNDSLSIQFDLRTDAFWHDNEKFNSEDVLFTYNLQVNETLAWDGYSFKESIAQVVATNDSTVVFHFREKLPTMLMDAVEGYILPEHQLGKIAVEELEGAEISRNPIGTGPFRFSEWKSQQSVTLEKNMDYYVEGKPRLLHHIPR